MAVITVNVICDNFSRFWHKPYTA